MNRYTTDLPCRPLSDGDECGNRVVRRPDDAAYVFADRYARRIYGRRGYCHHVRLDFWTANGRYFSYEAFVGIPNGYMGGTTGKNIMLTVTVTP